MTGLELSPLTAGLHMRALIRQAVVDVLAKDQACLPLLGGRVWPNRFEAWLSPELPAAGVYTTREEQLESSTSPDPDERRLSLEIELVAWADTRLDDMLDALALALEHALFRHRAIDALGREMASIAEARLGRPLPVQSNGRSVVDTLLTLELSGTDMGIAVDGERQLGVCNLGFNIEYAWPRLPGELDDFLLGVTGWDTVPADGRMEMLSRVEFPPASPTPEKEE